MVRERVNLTYYRSVRILYIIYIYDTHVSASNKQISTGVFGFKKHSTYVYINHVSASNKQISTGGQTYNQTLVLGLSAPYKTERLPEGALRPAQCVSTGLLGSPARVVNFCQDSLISVWGCHFLFALASESIENESYFFLLDSH